MRVLDGEKPGNAVNIENGAVVLNLVPAVNGVLGRLQDRGLLTDKNLPDLNDSQSPQEQISALSDALGLDLKPTFGQITVYENAKIDHAETYVSLAQKIAKQFKRLVVLIVLVALGAHRRHDPRCLRPAPCRDHVGDRRRGRGRARADRRETVGPTDPAAAD